MQEVVDIRAIPAHSELYWFCYITGYTDTQDTYMDV